MKTLTPPSTSRRRWPQISLLPVNSAMGPDVASLRLNAPGYIRSVLEHARKAAFLAEHCEQLTIMPVHGGGNMSACYVLSGPPGAYLLKFRLAGLGAEHTALAQWRRAGARAVPVVASGLVPATKAGPKPVKYLLVELIQDRAGRIAPTGTEFVQANPARIRSLGYQMGVELARMHRATTARTFGEYGDMWGKTVPYRSMNAFLLGYLDAHHAGLLSLGLSEAAQRLLRERLAKLRFVQLGRFLHGDYSLRNVLVESSRPLRITVIDPNPLVGDPTWDLAVLANNVDFARRRLVHDPMNSRAQRIYRQEQACLSGLTQGYQDTTRHKINDVRLKACQLVQSVFLHDIEVQKAKRRHKKPLTQLEVMIRREAIMEHVNDFLNILK